MAYSEALADRIRARLPGRRVEEKKMMGGLTFMVNGKMCVGVHGEDLMVRLDPAMHEQALGRPGARPMDFTGRPAAGFLFVGSRGTDDDASLDEWIESALAFNARAQPAKRRGRGASGR